MLELQYHPADIRGRVRYLFLRPKDLRWLAVALLAAGCLGAVAVASIPTGARALLLHLELRAAKREHLSALRSLEAQAVRLAGVQARLEQSTALHAKLGLLLGLPATEGFAGGRRAPELTDLSPDELLVWAERLADDAARLDAGAETLAAFVAEHRMVAEAVPSISPLPSGSFALSSPFGARTSPFTSAPDFHPGLDLAAKTGTRVTASGDGTVVFAGRVPLKEDVRWWRMGNCVVMNHGGLYVTVYGHLHAVSVAAGTRVRRGQAIGTVGSTGWSTSPHLHYEVRRVVEPGGEPVPLDPRIYILDHDWEEWESLLAARRASAPPAFDPLPTLLARR